MALSWAWPSIRMPSPPLGMADWMSLLVPTAVSVTCTPVALPPISMPLLRLPPMMQVRIRLLPPRRRDQDAVALVRCRGPEGERSRRRC